MAPPTACGSAGGALAAQRREASPPQWEALLTVASDAAEAPPATPGGPTSLAASKPPLPASGPAKSRGPAAASKADRKQRRQHRSVACQPPRTLKPLALRPLALKHAATPFAAAAAAKALPKAAFPAVRLCCRERGQLAAQAAASFVALLQKPPLPARLGKPEPCTPATAGGMQSEWSLVLGTPTYTMECRPFAAHQAPPAPVPSASAASSTSSAGSGSQRGARKTGLQDVLRALPCRDAALMLAQQSALLAPLSPAASAHRLPALPLACPAAVASVGDSEWAMASLLAQLPPEDALELSLARSFLAQF